MKLLLIGIIMSIWGGSNTLDRLSGSTWVCKIADGCIDTIKLKKNNTANEYDCELRYTFSGSYKIIKDTLLITLRDDSHSEDHGKITYYKMKYLMQKNALSLAYKGNLINNKWVFEKVKMEEKVSYQRIK